MQYSAQAMVPFLRQYSEAVEAVAGDRYGQNVNLDKTSMNIMKLAVDIWLRQLVSQNPSTLVITRSPGLRTAAYELELATNYLLKTINFGAAMADVVQSAIFLAGVMKVGLAAPYLKQGSGFSNQGGHPYAEMVLINDFLFDMNAKKPYEWEWVGNRYRVPYDEVMDNPDYDPDVKRALARGREESTGDFSGENTDPSELSVGNPLLKTEYREQVELWDIFIPSEQILVTMPAQQGLGPLIVRDWTGDERGPYRFLSFGNVLGNVIPSAPIQHLYHMQDLLTRLFNQLGRQAQRQKTVTVCDGQAEADGTAQRLMEAMDGHVIHTSHIDGVKEMNYGGVNADNFKFVIWMKEMMSYLGGNLDAMGGLSQQANTLGQEQLLVQSSSQMLKDMQAKVIAFASDVISDLARYLYEDPFSELSLEKPIESYGNIPFTYGPDRRVDNFFDFHFEIQPYSLQAKGPQERLSALMTIATTLLIPLSPQLAEMGLPFNWKRFLELIAKYGDLPEIAELVSSETPMQSEMAEAPNRGGGSRPLQSPVTQRNYTRRNVSTGGTQQSRDMQMMAALSSGGSEKE